MAENLDASATRSPSPSSICATGPNVGENGSLESALGWWGKTKLNPGDKRNSWSLNRRNLPSHPKLYALSAPCAPKLLSAASGTWLVLSLFLISCFPSQVIHPLLTICSFLLSPFLPSFDLLLNMSYYFLASCMWIIIFLCFSFIFIHSIDLIQHYRHIRKRVLAEKFNSHCIS